MIRSCGRHWGWRLQATCREGARTSEVSRDEGGQTGTVADAIASQTKRGALWQLAGKTCGFGITFAGGIALARLLSPDDFGLWALALFCMKFARQAASAGIQQSVVQRQELDDESRDTAFWISFLAGAVLWGVVYLLSPSIGAVWDNDRLSHCVRTIAVVIPMAGLLAVPQALLQRGMRFGALTIIGLLSSCAELGCGIVLALCHYGVYSLLMGTVAGALTTAIGICGTARYWPGSPSVRAAFPLLRFAIPVTGSYLVRLIASDADYLIIGKRLSAASVGLYRRAYSSTTTAVATVVFPLQDVLFPAFSRLQQQDDRLRYAFTRALSGLSAVIFPVTALLFVAAPEYIPLVYGAKWQASVAPTQVLCLAMVFMVVAEPSSSLLKGVGRAGTEAACQAIYMLLLCSGAWVGARWGITGVAWGVAGAVVVNGCALCVFAARSICLPATATCRALRSSVIGTSVAAVAAVLVRNALLAADANLWLVLGGTAVGGGATYALCVVGLPFPEGRDVLLLMVSECLRGVSAQAHRRD